MSIGFSLYLAGGNSFYAVLLVLVLLISYEMWEMLVGIVETPANRFMDVVVGILGYTAAFFLLAPELSRVLFIFVFGVVVVTNISMSIFGWRASQKAAVLKERLRARFRR